MENIKAKFDFDDILIVPSITTKIFSRYKDITLPENLPLFTAPMDTVVDLNNMKEFLNNGINVALPRTITYGQFLTEEILNHKTTDNGVFVSFGFNDLDNYYKNNFKDFHKDAHILIDVANGHMEKIVDYAKEIKRLRPDIIIMAGNIANPETYLWYANQGCVDYIRVGIGNGNGCLTTKQSGIGHPMASLIYEIRKQKDSFMRFRIEGDAMPPAIIADGGMKDYSDIIKSLALGADYVMIGSIFNKAFESSADNYLYGAKLNKKHAKYFFDKGYPIKKYFRGMSTKEAQKAMGKTHFRTSEGVTRFRRVEYHLDGWVENFEHYLRNMMSYVNAKTLDEFIGKVEICQISKNAYDRFNK
jgi:NAD(P)H-dependent flavin oxidoreductase YrpB (nitropropane dioxygenase family)